MPNADSLLFQVTKLDEALKAITDVSRQLDTHVATHEDQTARDRDREEVRARGTVKLSIPIQQADIPMLIGKKGGVCVCV